MNPLSRGYTVRFDADAIRAKLDSEEAFWDWLSNTVGPGDFLRLREHPKNIIQQIYAALWSANLDQLVKEKQREYRAPYETKLDEVLKRVRELAGLPNSASTTDLRGVLEKL